MKQFTLFFSLVLFSLPAAASTIAFWSFDNTLLDSSGNGFHLTNSGTTFVPGYAGQALSTNSTYASSGARGPANNFGFEFWMRSTQVPGGPAILVTTFDHTFGDLPPNGGDGTGGWMFRLDTQGRMIWDVTDPSNVQYTVTSANAVNNGQWVHIRGTLSPANVMELFVNGVSQGTRNAIAAPGERNGVRFGMSWEAAVSPLFPYVGLIDEAHFYTGTTSPIPEPGTLGLAAAALAVAAFRMRRR